MRYSDAEWLEIRGAVLKRDIAFYGEATEGLDRAICGMARAELAMLEDRVSSVPEFSVLRTARVRTLLQARAEIAAARTLEREIAAQRARLFEHGGIWAEG